MNVTTNEHQTIVDSIQKSNDLLLTIAAAKLGIEEKMMKADVTANVIDGLGEKVDLSA